VATIIEELRQRVQLERQLIARLKTANIRFTDAQLKKESQTLIEESGKQALKPEEYESKLNDFLERANELGKSSLAQYVAHRKVILEFLEKSLQANPETGKYPLEEIK
jgi:hypothetical protein